MTSGFIPGKVLNEVRKFYFPSSSCFDASDEKVTSLRCDDVTVVSFFFAASFVKSSSICVIRMMMGPSLPSEGRNEDDINCNLSSVIKWESLGYDLNTASILDINISYIKISDQNVGSYPRTSLPANSGNHILHGDAPPFKSA